MDVTSHADQWLVVTTGPASSDGLRGARADAAIRALAERQHGVVCREQLLRAGVGASLLVRRLEAGLLRPLHRGVYRVGPLAAPRSREMAAVLACGASACVSHRSATSLWLCAPQRSATEPVDIIVGDRRRRRRSGIRIHRIGTLHNDETTTIEGIPVTKPARTLFDLSAVATVAELEAALAEAFARALATRAELEVLLARHGNARRGAARLRSLLAAETTPARTRSEAEKVFLDLLRKARFPLPRVNVTVGGKRLDCFWPDKRIAVEIDGYAFHASQHRFQSDRRRDRELAAAGIQVIRITWHDLVKEPEATLVALALAFAAR